MKRRWRVAKIGDGWLVAPVGTYSWRELTFWTLWENALTHAQLMAATERAEPTA